MIKLSFIPCALMALITATSAMQHGGGQGDRPNPFAKRFQPTPYPTTFSASQIEQIINAPERATESGAKKRAAVVIPFRGSKNKVSIKAQDSYLTSIMRAISSEIIEEKLGKEYNFSSNEHVNVHPSITAEFSQLCQANYGGGTAQEEGKEGQLIEFVLKKNGQTLNYNPAQGPVSVPMKIILSITPCKK